MKRHPPTPVAGMPPYRCWRVKMRKRRYFQRDGTLIAAGSMIPGAAAPGIRYGPSWWNWQTRRVGGSVVIPTVQVRVLPTAPLWAWLATGP